jgi:hypothetical protein
MLHHLHGAVSSTVRFLPRCGFFHGAVLVTGLMWFLVLNIQAQDVARPGDAAPANAHIIAERAAHQRVWRRDNLVTLADGRVVNRPTGYTEMATGLHYWENGEWKESRDEIEVTPTGAAATKGQHQVYLAGNINSPGAIEIVTADQRTLKFRPVGLAYTDAATGNSVVLAPVRDAEGLLFAPNQVVYPAAFAGVLADVRVIYTKAGFESDVIVREKLPSPADYGLNPETTLLEVWHECDAPEPVKSARTLDGLTDETLTFGTMRIGRGGAFALDGPLHRMSGAPVSKTWLKAGNPERSYLIESVRYPRVRAELDQLPDRQAAVQAPVVRPRVALLATFSPPSVRAATPVRLAFDVKTLPPAKGLVLDYVAMNSQSDPLTLQADTTYLVSGAVSLTDLIIEGGTVVKYLGVGSTPYVEFYGTVDCQTGPYRPAIFTAKDDDTVGEIISGSTGTPSGYYGYFALMPQSGGNYLHDLRISHALWGLVMGGDNEVRHAQFTACDQAIQLSFCALTVDNTLFYRCSNAFSGFAGATLDARHLTAQNCFSMAHAPDADHAFNLTNSLLVNVTNWNTPGLGALNYFTNATVETTSTSTLQTVGSGAHYLADSSIHRQAGLTSIPAALAADLRQRTTYPPVVWTNTTLTTNVTLSPVIARGGSVPDLGYHYAPLDYVFGSNVLTNASLTINAGTALGTFTPGTNTQALLLQRSSSVVTRGEPTNLVHVARYNVVQEQANHSWSSASPGAGLRTVTSGVAPSPSGRFSFTEWTQAAQDSSHFVSHSTNLGPFSFSHCQFNGGRLNSFGAKMDVTNSLWLRLDAFISNEFGTERGRFYNNTLVGGLAIFDTSGGVNPPWEFFNNAFATTNVIAGLTGHVHGFNAYLTPGNRIGANASNDLVTNIVFQTGPLGRFYLTDSSPLTNRGNMNAGSAGLYWFTTATNQAPETNSTVDIGFHYLGLSSMNANAGPLDTDGDGVVNYIEDANGNGTREAEETSATRSDSPFMPRYEPLGPSSRRTPLVISEIMYHPSATNGGPEFVELYNTHHLAQKLDGFTLFNADDDVTIFTFGSLTLNPGNYTLVNLTNSLPDSATRLQLRNERGAVLLDVKYSGKPPWPAEANGAGHSLVLARPSYGENDSRAWAASERRGGSPGYAETNRVDFLRAVKINELIANGTGLDSVELYNACNQAIDISGCYLSDTTANLGFFRIPDGTVLQPRDFVTYYCHESFGTGFALNNDGESIFLSNPDLTRVIDAIRFEAQAPDVSMGRSPDGAPGFVELASLSIYGAPYTNGPAKAQQIIISEIMFNPISGSDDDEFIEIYNRGPTSQNLNGWKLDGVDFTFPNKTLEASSYFVISFSTNTVAKYPQLTNNLNLVGEYKPESLKNSVQRIALVNSNGVIMDEVTYSDGGRWGRWSDGDGSSLESIDPRSDNRLAANWSDSDETQKSGTNWTLVTYTNILDHSALTNIDRLEIMLGGAGECLVDDVQVWQSGTQFVVNSTFESGLTGWTSFKGTHDQSGLESTKGYNSSKSLRVRAAGRGEYLENRIRTQLTTPLTSNTSAAITARVLWLTGNRDILFRFSGGALEAAGTMPVPSNLGTPGFVNSRFKTNHGPAVSEVVHFPVVPAASEPVLVTARVHDPDGLAEFVLRYRVDPATNLTTLTMRDDGASGDALANDGLFTAFIPGQSAGTMLAYYLQAKDTLQSSNRFPADAPTRECLIRFGDPTPGGLTPYRIWMTQKTETDWRTRSPNHNTPLDSTFVYGDERVIYNAQGLYSGSKFNNGLYDGPTNKLCAYSLTMPSDDLVLGATDFALEMPSYDTAAQREEMGYWLAAELGLPRNHRRLIHLIANGMMAGARPSMRVSASQPVSAAIYEDTQQPNSDVLDQLFPDDNDGDFIKIEVQQEDSGAFIDTTLRPILTTNGVKKTARYRWNWRKRAVQDSVHNYTNLFQLVDAVNVTSNYTEQVEALVDVEQWMRVFALERIIGNWDSYGYTGGQGHNLYGYKPNSGRWQLLLWDLDVAFGADGRAPETSLFTPNDPALEEMIAHPPFRRMFWRMIYDAVNGPFQPAVFNPVLDANHTLISSNYTITTSDAATLLSPDGTNNTVPALRRWMTNQFSFLTGQLATVAAPFEISNNGGNNFAATNQTNITLTGKAPVQVAYLHVNGTNANVTWTSVTNWSTGIALPMGTNTVTVQGYDRLNQILSGLSDSIIITNKP